MTDLGMNERAWTIADACISRAAELRIVHAMASGARAIDAGGGGFAAGLALAELCMGDRGRGRARGTPIRP